MLPAKTTPSTTTLVAPDSSRSPNERTLLLDHAPPAGPSIHRVGDLVDPATIGEDGDEPSAEGVELDIYTPGKATFNQTLLNCLGDLIGTGLLACPIAIAHAGWIVGPLFLCIVSAVTLWTLKILIRIIALDRRMRNFADVARYGLGPRAERIITTIFIGDCCIWLIALIVLSSDSFEAVWPVLSSNQWKLVCMAIVIPLNFVPLRYLSFSSAVGVATTWTMVVILIFTGIVTPHYPGSIRDPAPTDLWPTHGLVKLGISFGLLISGFGGHFLIPNLIRDMKHPEKADRVVEVAYGICIVVYMVISVFGYLMFGREVSDEISRDLAQTSTFSPTMAKIAVAMVAINPLTKLPLGLRPLCDIIYSLIHLHPTVFVPLKPSPSQYTPSYIAPTLHPSPSSSPSSSSLDTLDTLPTNTYTYPKNKAEIAHDHRERLKSFGRPLISVILLACFVGGALILPSFETIMSLLGGGLSMISCVLIPIAAGANVWGWRWYAIFTFWSAAGLGILGVVCAILNNSLPA